MELCVINISMADWNPRGVEQKERLEAIETVSGCVYFRQWQYPGKKHKCMATEKNQCPATSLLQLATEVEVRWGG